MKSILKMFSISDLGSYRSTNVNDIIFHRIDRITRIKPAKGR